jgi:hypothetical protein
MPFNRIIVPILDELSIDTQFKEALFLYNKICKIDIGYRDVFDKFEELHDYVSKF